MMRRIILLAAALALAGPAYSQNVQFGVPVGRSGTAPGNVPLCFNSLGISVPPAMCDQAPSVIQGNKQATVENRPMVVTMAPNGGSSVGFPSSSTPITAVGTGTTGAVTATMAAAIGKTNWLCNAQVSALGGTATIGPVTITGLAGGNTLTYYPASSAAGNLFIINFLPCFPASATNTAIAMATTADGTASNVAVNLLGYRQ